MTRSKWDELNLEEKVLKILNVRAHGQYRTQRPFQTGYQIAIAFKEAYPSDFAKLGLPVGGKRIGQQDSLSQYLARELTRRINNKSIVNVERTFFHRKFLKGLTYNDEGQEVESSAEQAYDLSMFRRTD